MAPRRRDHSYDELPLRPRRETPAPARRRPHRGIPSPVRPRQGWFVFATAAVLGTLAAALLPSPWSIVCGVIAAFGATGAFVLFVMIVVLEDSDSP